ncbi:unnamed protein product [Oikopleura dioica]|uniref:Copper type II ascorbate-dependent monooxygenase N-terminal domain-containing protein n=1 Tax=Oikopleura dioica TaxID=34765 RepID=E4YQB0_OIKDI|nr:unnamed protein product [Oikopleura dioica]
MKRIFLLLGIARALVLEDDLSITWEVKDEIFRIQVHVDAENMEFPFGIGINRRDDGISKESELLWFTKDDFNQKLFSENGDFTNSTASVWSLNETSESKLLIIERPVCASTSEFNYVTIDSKTLTLVWSPPGVDLSAENWKSKLLHFQEFGNPPKAGCEDENGEFCEEYTVKANLTAERTQYWCKLVELPKEKSQMVGFELIAEKSEKYLHHALLYGCSGIPDGDLDFNEEFVCGDYTMMHLMKCFHAVAIAAVGSTSFDYPAEAGFPLGPGEMQFAILEVHYDNPFGDSGVEMNSGLKLKMTKNLRENEAGHISVGATWMFYLPPNAASFNLRGTCPHQCIEALTDEDYEMNIFAHSSHSHAYAKSSKNYFKT